MCGKEFRAAVFRMRSRLAAMPSRGECTRKSERRMGLPQYRMPVAAVFENLEDGVTIDELVELYDGLTRNQVKSVLDFAARSL